MAKSYNQKLKLLYIAKFLNEHTDFEHFLSLNRILDLLSEKGIEAERKSIYSDLEALKLFGLPVEYMGGHKGGYYLINHSFDLAELKLLVDAVQQSRFITKTKSSLLIDKLAGLASIHQRSQLKRSVHIMERIKTMNESIFYNVDYIDSAILEEKKISFRYYDWDVNKEKIFHNKGEKYTVSPYALTWDNLNYYLIGSDEASSVIKHFRVDKMCDLTTLDEKSTPVDKEFIRDIGHYTQKSFSMFHGELKNVKLICDNSLSGILIDRFGKDINLVKQENGKFSVAVSVMVSPQFYSWVCGLGDKIEIAAPEEVRNGFIEELDKIKRVYG